MLRKDVCKNCKIKATGSGGWVPHSEMLWKDANVVRCPTSVIVSFTKKLQKKIRKVTSFSAAEKDFITEGLTPHGKPFQTTSSIKEKPPIFCPNKEKHKNVKERSM